MDAAALNVAATIYNERSCSQAECHAHPDKIRVLGVLDVALRLDVLDQEAATMRGNVIITAVLQILLAGIMIVLLIRRFVEVPIRDLIAGTKAVAKMDLDNPISIRYKSQELEELEESFNIMRVRLRTALRRTERIRQSSGSASRGTHRAIESRTPKASTQRPTGIARPTCCERCS